jgi:hypothetical protein
MFPKPVADATLSRKELVRWPARPVYPRYLPTYRAAQLVSFGPGTDMPLLHGRAIDLA